MTKYIQECLARKDYEALDAELESLENIKKTMVEYRSTYEQRFEVEQQIKEIRLLICSL